MNNTPDASANDTGGTGLRHEIAALSTGIAKARHGISAGNVIDLSGFLKGNFFYLAVASFILYKFGCDSSRRPRVVE